MGTHDSTRTRVAPVFDALLARAATGRSWLPALLALPALAGRSAACDQERAFLNA
jgi:hypothetical protein